MTGPAPISPGNCPTARALRFDPVAVAYDVHILRRPNAERDHAPAIVEAAARYHRKLSEEARVRLERTIIAGLPGSEESFTSAEFLAQIGTYEGIDADRLRANHAAFLDAVCPLAEEAGIQLVVHPDAPASPVFGLPRVVSTGADVARLFARMSSVAKGYASVPGRCRRAYRQRPAGMVERLGARIGFLHLRSVAREVDGAFHEAGTWLAMQGMVAALSAVVRLSRDQRRSIPIRRDHGRQMLDNLNWRTNPGYSLLGRMHGLAELRRLERGAVHALDAEQPS